MPSIPKPSDGKGPMMGSDGPMNPTKPADKVGKIARGAPTRNSGSDTSPYSSARGRKG